VLRGVLAQDPAAGRVEHEYARFAFRRDDLPLPVAREGDEAVAVGVVVVVEEVIEPVPALLPLRVEHERADDDLVDGVAVQVHGIHVVAKVVLPLQLRVTPPRLQARVVRRDHDRVAAVAQQHYVARRAR